jgi:hypothetical protein
VRVALDPGDPSAYCALLTGLWAAGGTFVIVEHDIGVHADVLRGFDACPEPWCGYVYQLPGVIDAALGCTQFRTELLAAAPDAMTVSAAKADDLPAGHWAHLDAHLRTVLESRGYRLHRHRPPVAHYH